MRRHAIWMVTIGCMVSPWVLGQGPKQEPAYFTGEVVPLEQIVTKAGGKMDVDAVAATLVFRTDDGNLLTLVKDDGSRMFFLDKRLLAKRMRLTGKLIPKSRIMQVLEVHSLKDNAINEIYYWCDICIIKRYEKKMCDCCGEPMELRETLLGS